MVHGDYITDIDCTIYPQVRHDMDIFSALMGPSAGNPVASGVSLQMASNASLLHLLDKQSICRFEMEWRASIRSSYSLYYSDVVMNMMASQITSLTIVYSTVYSDADQRKHQSSASLAFVSPENSPHKWPVTRKMFPFDVVIMNKSGIYHWHHAFSPKYYDIESINDKKATNLNAYN